jgi:hypothetical protein
VFLQFLQSPNIQLLALLLIQFQQVLNTFELELSEAAAVVVALQTLVPEERVVQAVLLCLDLS